MSLKEARAALRLIGAFVMTPSMTQPAVPGLPLDVTGTTAAAPPPREMRSLAHVTSAHRDLAVPGQVVPRRAAHRGGRGAVGPGRRSPLDGGGHRGQPGHRARAPA